MHGHHEANGFFPSGGWGWFWVGDPDRGTGKEQPGGWVYPLLAHLEQVPLHQAGSDGQGDSFSSGQLVAGAERIQTALPMYQCPSRRRAIGYPVQDNLRQPLGAAATKVNARTDYSACAGDQRQPWDLRGPDSLAAAKVLTESGSWPKIASFSTGISYLRSQITLGQIRDGSSNTYMIGEKYLNPDNYTSGRDGADNESMYCGYNNDNHRSTFFNPVSGENWQPMQDVPGLRIALYLWKRSHCGTEHGF